MKKILLLILLSAFIYGPRAEAVGYAGSDLLVNPITRQCGYGVGGDENKDYPEPAIWKKYIISYIPVPNTSNMQPELKVVGDCLQEKSNTGDSAYLKYICYIDNKEARATRYSDKSACEQNCFEPILKTDYGTCTYENAESCCKQLGLIYVGQVYGNSSLIAMGLVLVLIIGVIVLAFWFVRRHLGKR